MGDGAYVRVTHHNSLNPGTGSLTATFWANVGPTGADDVAGIVVPVSKRAGVILVEIAAEDGLMLCHIPAVGSGSPRPA